MHCKAEQLKSLAFGAPAVPKTRLSITDTFSVPPNSSHAPTKPPPPLQCRKPIADQRKPMADEIIGAFSVSGTQVRKEPSMTKPEVLDDNFALLKEMMKDEMVSPQVSQIADDLQEPSPLSQLADDLQEPSPMSQIADSRQEPLHLNPVVIDDDDDNEIVPDSQEADHSVEELFKLVDQKKVADIPKPLSKSSYGRVLRSSNKSLVEASTIDPDNSRIVKRSREIQADSDFLDIDSPSTRKSKRTSKNGKVPVIQGPIPVVPADFEQLLESCHFLKGRKQADMTFGELKIKGHDLYTLRPREYLNDLIIDHYLELICKRNQNCFAFNTYFYPMLTSKKEYDDLVSWLKLDFSVHNLVFLPINEENHWYLFVADFKVKNYFIYDSLYIGDYKTETEHIISFLTYYAAIKGFPMDLSEWSSAPVEEQLGPTQSNGIDCGIFLCQYCEHLSRQAKLDYTQHGMSNFRKIMQYELLKGELLPKNE